MAVAVRITRTAISPRLATNRGRNGRYCPVPAFRSSPVIAASSCTSDRRHVLRSSSHPEQAETRGLDRRVGRRRKAKAQHQPGIGRIDPPVVPKAGGGVIRAALALVLRADRRAKLFLLLSRPPFPLGFDIVAPNLAQNHRRLLPAHDRYARVRPHPEEARAVGAAAHSVIAGSVGAADHDSGFWHGGRWQRRG